MLVDDVGGTAVIRYICKTNTQSRAHQVGEQTCYEDAAQPHAPLPPRLSRYVKLSSDSSNCRLKG